MATKSGDCYIDVWREKDFGGETIRIYGPAEYPALEFSQGDWCDDIGSLRVGPNAFVMAYHGRDFKDKLITFGPNDEAADLSDFKFDDQIESMKVIDSLKIFDRVGYNPIPDTAPEESGSARPNLNKGKRSKGRKR